MAVSALVELKTQLNLANSCRRTYFTKIDFSFYMQGRPFQSRLDRIYIAEYLLNFANNWKIEYTAVNTDYLLVSTNIVHPRQPWIGKGRYAILISLLDDKNLIDKLEEIEMLSQGL